MFYEDFSTWSKRTEAIPDTTTGRSTAPDPAPPATVNKWQQLTESYSAADAGSLGVSADATGNAVQTTNHQPEPTITDLNNEVRDSVSPGNFSDGRNASAMRRQQAAIGEHLGTENPELYQPDVVAYAERNGVSYNEAVHVLNERNAELPPHVRSYVPTESLRPVAELAADYVPDRAIDGSRGSLDVTHGSVYDRTSVVLPDTTADDQARVDNRLGEIADETRKLQAGIDALGVTGGRAGAAMQAQLDELHAEATMLVPLEEVGFGDLDDPATAAAAVNYYDASAHERGNGDPLSQTALHQRNEAVLRFAGGDVERADDIITNLNNGMGVNNALTLSAYKMGVAGLSESEGYSTEVAERLVAMQYHGAGVSLPGVVQAFDPVEVFGGARSEDFDTAQQRMAGETAPEADDFTSVDDFDAIVANPNEYHPDVVATAIVYKQLLDNPEILGEENHAEFQQQFTRDSFMQQLADSPWNDRETDSWVVNLSRMAGGQPPSTAFVHRVIEDGPGAVRDLDNALAEFRPENQAMLLFTDRDQAFDNYKSFGGGVVDWGVDAVKLGVGVSALSNPALNYSLQKAFGINVHQEATDMVLSSGELLINDPDAMGEAVIGWDQLLDDPWRWAGTVAPEIIIEIATMGGATPFTAGTKAATTGLRAADAATDVASAARRAAPDALDAGTDFALTAGKAPDNPAFGDPVIDVVDGGGVFDPNDVLDSAIEMPADADGRRAPDDFGDDVPIDVAVAADSPPPERRPSADEDAARVDEVDDADQATLIEESLDQERVPVGVGAVDQQFENATVGARGADNSDTPTASADRSTGGGVAKPDNASTTSELKAGADENSPSTQRGGGDEEPPPPDTGAPGGFADDEMPDLKSLEKKEQAGDSPGYLDGEVSKIAGEEDLGTVVETYIDGDDGYIHVVEKHSGERTILYEDPDGSVRVGPEIPEPVVPAVDLPSETRVRPEHGLIALDRGVAELYLKHQDYFEEHGMDIKEVGDGAHEAKHSDTSELGAADDFVIDMETGDVWPPIAADDGYPAGNIYQQLNIDPPPD